VIDPAVDLVVRWSLALLFATAAYHKLGDFESFRMVMRDYGLLPQRLVGSAAACLVGFEASLAVALITGVLRIAVSGAVVLLLACYSTAIAVNLVRGRRDIGCGCSGAMHKQLISWWLVLRNAVLIVGGALLAAPVVSRRLIALDVYTVAVGVLTLSLLYAAANRLVSEWPAHLRTLPPRSSRVAAARL